MHVCNLNLYLDFPFVCAKEAAGIIISRCIRINRALSSWGEFYRNNSFIPDALVQVAWLQINSVVVAYSLFVFIASCVIHEIVTGGMGFLFANCAL